MATEAAVVTGVYDDAATNTQDWTKTGFGTPTAALVFSSSAGPASNPRNDAYVSMGFTVGGNGYTGMIASEDGQTTANTNRKLDTNRIAEIYEQGTTLKLGMTASFITDGIRMTTQDDSTTLERFGSALLFKGTRNEAVGSINLGTGTSPINVSVGFKPDVVFFLCVGTGNESTAAHAIMSFGVAHNDSTDTVTQRSLHMSSQDAQGTSVFRGHMRENCIASQYTWGSFTYTVTAESFAAGASNNFTVTPSASAASDLVYYLALQLADPDDFWLDTIDTQDGTAAVKAYTGTGFAPDAIGLFGVPLTAVSTNSNLVSASFGIGDRLSERSVIYHEDDDGTTDTWSRKTDTVLDYYFQDHTLADSSAGIFSLDGDGFTLNFTDPSTSGFAKKILAFAVGDSTAKLPARSGGGFTVTTAGAPSGADIEVIGAYYKNLLAGRSYH